MGKINKAKGNMYDWVTHTWSPGRGCPHQCRYCYVRSFGVQPVDYTPDLPFPPLGKGRKIFVGHMCDLFANGVPVADTRAVLDHVRQFPCNIYVFQTKAPLRALAFADGIPGNSVIGTTIESNWDSVLIDYMEDSTTAPVVEDRAKGLLQLRELGYQTFLTIEPIIDFHPAEMLRLVKLADPCKVYIGADSKGHGLPEPAADEIERLIIKLREAHFPVFPKDNLKRLLPEGFA